MDKGRCFLVETDMEGFGIRMKVNYFRERKEHHMVIAAGEYQCPVYQMRMMEENSINGLIVPVVRRMNGEVLYDYSITECQSLQTYAELSPISGQVLAALIRTLNRVLAEMERYLVDGDYLALRPEFIYLKVKGQAVQEVKFCFFPFYGQGAEDQMKEVLKYVLNEVDYQEKKAVNLAYELFQQSQQEDFLIKQLNQLVEENVIDQDVSEKQELLVEKAEVFSAQPVSCAEMKRFDDNVLSKEQKSEGVRARKRLFPGRIGKRDREIVLSDILK